MNAYPLISRMYRVFLAVAAVVFFSAWGGDLKEIKKTAGTLHSISAEFIQRKNLKILSRPLVSRGKLFFRTPSSLRWEYMSPVESVLLMHGGNVKRYVRHEGRMSEDSSARLQSMQVVMNEIVGWFRGDFDSSRTFSASLRPGGIVVLVPRDKALTRVIQRIELKLSRRPGVIDRVSIIEGPDSVTILEFRSVVLNGEIPEAIFKKM